VLALRGTRLIGTLLPGLVGASAIAKRSDEVSETV
jgi:hypothetical protein